MKNSLMFKVCSIAVLLMFLLSAVSLSAGGKSEDTAKSTTKSIVNPDVLVDAPFKDWVEGLPKIQAPSGFNWRQYDGIVLNFISENTTPSTALAASINQFTDYTGITVNIEQADLSVVVEKVGLDINSKSAKYALVYADPYQILAKNFKSFADLNQFNNNPMLPHIPGGLEDFIQSQLIVTGYMNDRDSLYALPYDAPTMILGYRKDVFDKYKSSFMQEMGYDWTPDEDMTWEQYYEIASWINNKVKSGLITEVKYGTGHQAAQYDSLMCDFSNILSAYGGDYFEAENLGTLGSPKPGKSIANSKEAIAAAEFYNKLLSIAAPGSPSWDWSGLSESFAAGDIALAPEWHEFSASWENPASSRVAGKVAWDVLPKGPSRSGNIYGGTGVAISKYATEDEQNAAWLFLLWATSPQAQYSILKSEVGGSTPTRYSVYELEDVKKGMQPGTMESKEMANLLSSRAVLKAWENENAYMRPKTPLWPQFDSIIYTELSKMLAGKQTPEKTMNEISKQCNDLTGN